MTQVRYKLPRSIQVVIFTGAGEGRRYLLLRRVPQHGAFWQSITGSLEDGETHAQAAIREVGEETGLSQIEDDLRKLGVVNTFEIAPLWRERYAPGVTHNEEVCFALKVDEFEPILDSLEHDSHAWVQYDDAIKMSYWESTKRALASARSLED
jgi:dATP pyrophosphohydrolase